MAQVQCLAADGSHVGKPFDFQPADHRRADQATVSGHEDRGLSVDHGATLALRGRRVSRVADSSHGRQVGA